MTKPQLVLIHGLKFSGKSTLASHLINSHGYARVKMADPLKNMVRSLLRDAGIEESRIEEYIEGNLKETPIAELGGTTSRHMMMTLGDEWRNMHGRELWVNIAKAKIISLLKQGESVVVDDIRYQFELDNLEILNPFKTVITRGPLHFEAFGEDRHPGERPMPVSGFDFHFENNDDTTNRLWTLADTVLRVRGDYEMEINDLTATYKGRLKELQISYGQQEAA